MKKILWNIFVVILILIAIIGDIQMANSSRQDDAEMNASSAPEIQDTDFPVEKCDVCGKN